MVSFTEKSRYDYQDLLKIIRILRSPDGCPWDRVQTHASIRRGLLEESYEAAEAIDLDSAPLLQEELGDVLMQVVFHADIEKDRGRFTMEDVVDGVVKKLLFRHPNIFAAPDAAPITWEDLKRLEKGYKSTFEAMDSVARSLPGLWRAEKLQKKAADTGLDPTDLSEALERLEADVRALRQAAENGATANAVGEVLFAAVKVAQLTGTDPEAAIADTCEQFLRHIQDAERDCAPAQTCAAHTK